MHKNAGGGETKGPICGRALGGGGRSRNQKAQVSGHFDYGRALNAVIRSGYGPCPGIATHRRRAEGPVDGRLPVVEVEALHGWSLPRSAGTGRSVPARRGAAASAERAFLATPGAV
jgi:hypothetical protein